MRFFYFTFFMIGLNMFVPIVNSWGIFPIQIASSPSVGSSVVLGAAGCTVYTNGSNSCTNNASGAAPQSTGFLGSLSNSVLVFGNWFAALGIVGQMIVSLGLPGYFLTAWGGPLLLPISAIITMLGYALYLEAAVYFIGGRDVEH